MPEFLWWSSIPLLGMSDRSAGLACFFLQQHKAFNMAVNVKNAGDADLKACTSFGGAKRMYNAWPKAC